jgi:hypothetical protein
MSNILYYSKFCDFSKKLLVELSKNNVKSDLHFVCIDKRIKKNNITYIVLDNGTEVLLPPNIKKVPSLLLLNRGGIVIEGDAIRSHLLGHIQKKKENNEPECYSMENFGTILSDKFSFLDQSSDELLAKGDGGLRQIHNYATINQNDSIETPHSDYKPDKVGNVNLNEIRAQRDKEVPRSIQRL